MPGQGLPMQWTLDIRHMYLSEVGHPRQWSRNRPCCLFDGSGLCLIGGNRDFRLHSPRSTRLGPSHDKDGTEAGSRRLARTGFGSHFT
jgi:hypothetical protein